MRGLLLLGLTTACGRVDFDEPPHLESITHVSGDVAIAGYGVLVLGPATIDTDTLTIDGEPLVAGQLFATPQASGPELAVLDAYAVTIAGDVRVIGTRALVIAARTIDVRAVLDVSAAGTMPGPGATTDATAQGSIGAHSGVQDSGGGGGGHGTVGAPGGSGGGLMRGEGGALAGDAALTILAGGGRGGPGVAAVCGDQAGGGGGGAIQLSAAARVTIAPTGSVVAGGGGGLGGAECMDADAGAAAGGGAGGAIYLEAPHLELFGDVLAHGGGGGGGGNGSSGNGAVGSGNSGADGRTIAPAVGGTPAAPNGGTGGTGGTGDQVPTMGGDAMHNAGGGGGAAGRIVLRGERHGNGIVSPPSS